MASSKNDREPFNKTHEPFEADISFTTDSGSLGRWMGDKFRNQHFDTLGPENPSLDVQLTRTDPSGVASTSQRPVHPTVLRLRNRVAESREMHGPDDRVWQSSIPGFTIRGGHLDGISYKFGSGTATMTSSMDMERIARAGMSEGEQAILAGTLMDATVPLVARARRGALGRESVRLTDAANPPQVRATFTFSHEDDFTETWKVSGISGVSVGDVMADLWASFPGDHGAPERRWQEICPGGFPATVSLDDCTVIFNKPSLKSRTSGRTDFSRLRPSRRLKRLPATMPPGVNASDWLIGQGLDPSNYNI